MILWLRGLDETAPGPTGLEGNRVLFRTSLSGEELVLIQRERQATEEHLKGLEDARSRIRRRATDVSPEGGVRGLVVLPVAQDDGSMVLVDMAPYEN